MAEKSSQALTVADVADALKVSKKTVLRMVRAGQLSRIPRLRCIRIPAREVDLLLEPTKS